MQRDLELVTRDITASVRENVDELIEAIDCDVYLRMVVIAARMNASDALVLGKAVQGIVAAAEKNAIDHLVEATLTSKGF